MTTTASQPSSACANFMAHARAAAAGQPAPAVPQGHAQNPGQQQNPPRRQQPANQAQPAQPVQQVHVQAGGGGNNAGGNAGGGGGGGGNANPNNGPFLSPKEKRGLFWIGMIVLVMLAGLGANYAMGLMAMDYQTKDVALQSQRANIPQRPAQASAAYQPAPVSQPQAQSAARPVIDDIRNGMEVTLPENAKIVLDGPMEVVLLNSAHRIKSHTGDFKLWVENSHNWAWTPGYSSETTTTPMSVDSFLWHLKRRPAETRVRVYVQGKVEFTT